MSWRDSLGYPGMSVREAIRAIDDGASQICLIVDQNEKLVGTVTDGDVRRAILAGYDIDGPIEKIMNPKPATAGLDDTPQVIAEMMQKLRLRQIPVLDSSGRICELALQGAVSGRVQERDNLVVLMAGGLGTRLRPLTTETPKPLLPVGNRPLLETIVEGFSAQGFSKFHMCVNYKAEMIEGHFGNGDKWGVEIQYLRENEKSGTVGGLRHLGEKPTAPIIVMNGDLLTKINYQHLLDFHLQNHAVATMCVREYEWQVPFGVVELDHNKLTRITEKPKHSSFVNAGIYVLEPELLDRIPTEGAYDMTTLFEFAIAKHENVVAFPIREYWLDVGYEDDLAKARVEFEEVFGE